MDQLPRFMGDGASTEMVPYTREQMEQLSATLQRGAVVDLGGAFKGRLVAVLIASGTILIERDNHPDVEVQMMDNPILN